MVVCRITTLKHRRGRGSSEKEPSAHSDREGDAALYRFYGRPSEGGVFFDVVQREPGYDGYGAPNAPFRIAAQKRLMRPKGMPRR